MFAAMFMIQPQGIQITEELQELLSRTFLKIGYALCAESAKKILSQQRNKTYSYINIMKEAVPRAQPLSFFMNILQAVRTPFRIG